MVIIKPQFLLTAVTRNIRYEINDQFSKNEGYEKIVGSKTGNIENIECAVKDVHKNHDFGRYLSKNLHLQVLADIEPMQLNDLQLPNNLNRFFI